MRAEVALTPLYLPVDVRASDDFQADVKIVYGRLCSPERRRQKFVEVETNALAAETGKAERNVSHAIARLKQAKLIKHVEVHDGRIFLLLTPPAGSWSIIPVPSAVIAWPQLRGATQLCYAHLWAGMRGRRHPSEIEHSQLPGTKESNDGKRWLENLDAVGLVKILERRRGFTTIKLIDPDHAWEAHLHAQRRKYAKSIA